MNHKIKIEVELDMFDQEEEAIYRKICREARHLYEERLELQDEKYRHLDLDYITYRIAFIETIKKALAK